MPRSVLAIVAGFVILLAGALVFGRNVGSSPPPATAPTAASKVEVVQPSRDVPLPEAAAVEVVALTAEVAAAGFISRRDLIESVCTPEFGPRLADETSDQLDDLMLEFAQRGENAAALSVVEQPVRVRIVSATSAQARVAVWSVLVVAAPGAATARVMWRTVTLDLALLDGRWLVDGWESNPGPTPVVSPDAVVSPAGDVADRIGWSAVGVK